MIRSLLHPQLKPRKFLHNVGKLQKLWPQSFASLLQPLQEGNRDVCQGPAGSASGFRETRNLQLPLLSLVRGQCLWSLLALGAALSSSMVKRELNT